MRLELHDDQKKHRDEVQEEEGVITEKTNSLLATEALIKQWEDDEKRAMEEIAAKDRMLALKLQPKQCPVCLDDMDIDFIHVLKCSHEACRDCIKTHITNFINEKSFPILCPMYKCKQEITLEDMELLLDPKMLEKYINNSLASAVQKNPAVFSCCPTPNCEYVFFQTQNDSPDFGCPLCKKRYCLQCKVDYHSGTSCEDYQKWSLENGTADDLFSDFVIGNKYKKCPGCQQWVSKSEGCNHMSCRCGFEFCYSCGKHYPCTCGGESDDEHYSGEEEEEYYWS